MQAIPSVSVVIPCFNEAKRLPILEYEKFFSEIPTNLQFLFVDDGSSDDTLKLLEQLSAGFPAVVSTLALSKNVGKAEAVRSGILKMVKNKPDFVAYWDADLSTSLQEIKRFEEFLSRHKDASLLLGSRVKLHGSTVIIRNEFRHYIGRLVATVISSILKLSIYDTQCGAKFIATDDAEHIFDRPFLSRWLFDVEIIFRILERRGYENIEQKIFEVPLSSWIEKGDSKVSWTYFFKLPIDLLKLATSYSKVRKGA